MEILCRDLVKRAEVLLRDRVIEILYRQSPLKDAGMRAKGIIWQIILSIVRIPGVLSTWHSALRAICCLDILMSILSTAQPRTKRAWQSWGAAFPHLLKFQHKKALVACPCAFRLWNGRPSLGARHYSCSESLRTDLATETSFREILYKGLLWTPCTEILPRGLLQRSCQQSSYRDLAQRSCRDRHCIEICCRDLAKKSLAEILPTESLYRACTEISSRNLAKTSLIEGSLEVKLPTIWADEKQSRAEAERRGRLEERRSEEKE